VNNIPHKPVLLAETIDSLSPKKGGRYLDLTAGFGGHASLMAELVGDQGRLTLVDRDSDAINYLKSTFGSDPRAKIIRDDFCSAALKLLKNGEKFDCILADIGVSSHQLDNSRRGFAFDKAGPLDMRMDTGQAISAFDVANDYAKADLARIFAEYGGLSPKQASAASEKVLASRPMHSTEDLVHAISGVPAKRGKRLEAQVFQAIRIQVNNELGLLKKSLPVWAELLAPHGKLAVISFHSLEDRIVKQFFVQHSRNRYEADLKLLNKKPITAKKNEIVYNPRARSAKLRAAVKK
jgi:16S rRNA (cytosine1402-N4)-methyltransferase